MSREVAATVYLDDLLGFHRDFIEYYEAADTFTDDDKIILEQAASGSLNCAAEQKSSFIGSFNEIDNQNQ